MKLWFGIFLPALCLLTPLRAHTLIVFGDSVTAPRAGVEVYARTLSEELSFGGEQIAVINAGVPGNTTTQALKRLDADVLQKHPDTVVVCFGINDSAVDVWKNPPAARARVPLGEYRANLKACAGLVKAAGARVVLMTPNPLFWSETTRRMYGKPPYSPGDPDGFNVLLRDYAAAVREVAREESAVLVDLFEIFKSELGSGSAKPARLLPDGMHPNSEGQRLIAESLMKSLCSADPRYARSANTVWTPSGEVIKVHPLAHGRR